MNLFFETGFKKHFWRPVSKNTLAPAGSGPGPRSSENIPQTKHAISAWSTPGRQDPSRKAFLEYSRQIYPTCQPGVLQADRILPGRFQACEIREIGADARRYPTCRAAMFQEDCRKDPEHRILPGISQEGPCFQVAAKPCTYLVLQKWPLPAWILPGRFQEVSRNLPGRIQENTVESMETELFREDIPSWKLPGGQCGRILPGRMLDGRIKEGCLKHPSWKDPGKHVGIHGFCTFPRGCPFLESSRRTMRTGRMLDGRILPASFQHPSRKTARESPVRLEVSWKQPGRTAPDIRIRIYPDISDPASLEYSWNLPGSSNDSQEYSRQTGPGSILFAWKTPGSFQESSRKRNGMLRLFHTNTVFGK